MRVAEPGVETVRRRRALTTDGDACDMRTIYGILNVMQCTRKQKWRGVRMRTSSGSGYGMSNHAIAKGRSSSESELRTTENGGRAGRDTANKLAQKP